MNLDGRAIAGRVMRMSPGTAVFVGRAGAPAPVTRWNCGSRASIARCGRGSSRPTDGGVNLQLSLGHDHLSLRRADPRPASELKAAA